MSCNLNLYVQTLKSLQISEGWMEVANGTEMQPFDPRREVIELKLESDKTNPLDEVADLTNEFMIRIELNLYNDVTMDEELARISSGYKIREGNITKTMETLAMRNVDGGGTKIECTEYNKFLKIAEEGRLPKHIEVDLLNESVITGEKIYKTSHLRSPRTKCVELSPLWSSFVTAGSIKHMNAAFSDNNGENIDRMGWKCFLKVSTKWKGRYCELSRVPYLWGVVCSM